MLVPVEGSTLRRHARNTLPCCYTSATCADSIVFCAQEEEEQDYHKRFPDFFRGFQDLEALEGEGPVDDDRQPHEEHQHDAAGKDVGDTAAAAQATTAAASSLLQGEVLAELVALHARCGSSCGSLNEGKGIRLTRLWIAAP